MASLILKRSVVVGGRKTSVSLEDLFWKSLREIASGGDMTLSALLAAIDSKRDHGNLSSAIRLFVLNFYREQVGDQLQNRRKTIRALISRSVSKLKSLPSPPC
jgi:predicted DNA-binding ribbon-helix-helix protein